MTCPIDLEPRIGNRRFYSVGQAAAMLECSTLKVRNLIKAGRLGAIRLGSDRASFRIPSDALDEFVAQNAFSAETEAAVNA